MACGKTIRQIAEELGVSKQAVHQKRKTEALATALQPFTEIFDGVVYIAPEGEKLLKQAFAKPETPTASTVDDNQFTSVDGRVDGTEHPLYAILKAELEAKNKLIEQLRTDLAEERKHSREQADKLGQLADQAQRLHAGTIKTQLPEGGSAEEPDVIETVQEDARASVPDEKEILQGFLQDAKKEIDALNAEKVQTQEAVIQGLSWREIIRLKFKKGK